MSVHPYSDPIGSGLVQLTPTQRLNNPDLYRQRPMTGGPSFGGGHAVGSPLEDLQGRVSEVLDSAGHRLADSADESGESEGHWSRYAEADAPSQGIYETADGGLLHVRRNRNGTASLTQVGQTGRRQWTTRSTGADTFAATPGRGFTRHFRSGGYDPQGNASSTDLATGTTHFYTRTEGAPGTVHYRGSIGGPRGTGSS